jgi:hypothetical protein
LQGAKQQPLLQFSGRTARFFYGRSVQGLWDKGGHRGAVERGLKEDLLVDFLNRLNVLDAQRLNLV